MPSISFLVILALIVIFSDAHAVHPTPIEHDAFEKRVKQADTIIFGRFHWLLPIGKIDGIDSIHATQQDTFEFIVYCTMKNKKSPNNIPHVIVVTIEDYEARMTMRKNRWFVLFPEQTKDRNRWSINNRSDAYDLEDELELHVFEQFCFLNPKLPIGFPTNGLLNRCPRPSPEHCLKNGTRIRPDELLELKTFLTSTKPPKAKPAKGKPTSSSTSTRTSTKKQFIEPVW